MAIDWNKFDRERSIQLDPNLQVTATCGICLEHTQMKFHDSDLDLLVCDDCDTHARAAIVDMRKSVTNPDYGKGKKV